jgi:aminoglycoside 6'-N-acetyltransferase I
MTSASDVALMKSNPGNDPLHFVMSDGFEADWLALRLALWPEENEEGHRRGMADARRRGHLVLLARDLEGTLGFIEASVRKDYVNGTSGSPVGFLEGLYVVPQSRRRGVARALVERAIAWAREHGCTELASDSLLDNLEAQAVHRAIGFEESERVVYFRRDIRKSN